MDQQVLDPGNSNTGLLSPLLYGTRDPNTLPSPPLRDSSWAFVEHQNSNIPGIVLRAATSTMSKQKIECKTSPHDPHEAPKIAGL